MCDPVTITLATVAGASGVGGQVLDFMGEKQMAKAQEDYQVQTAIAVNKQISENARLAKLAYVNKVAQEQLGIGQEREAMIARLQDKRAERQQAQAATRVLAAEGGVQGLSLNNLMADYTRQEATFADRSRRSLSFTEAKAQANINDAAVEYAGRVQSIQPYRGQLITKPSILKPILGSAQQLSTLGLSVLKAGA